MRFIFSPPKTRQHIASKEIFAPPSHQTAKSKRKNKRVDLAEND
jgi:hypothetical protein